MGSADSAGDSASKAHETRRCDASLVMHWRDALAGKCVYERPMARIGVMGRLCLYTVSRLEYARVGLIFRFLCME
jgi:hypothetical protein